MYVGGSRNAFGTRIAKRVTCARCGKEDHVPHAPKDASKAMCRACAALVLRAYEVGTRAPIDTRPETCNLCGTPFRIPLAVEDRQADRVRAFKKSRDHAAVRACLDRVREAARGDANLMPALVEAVDRGVSVGEISDVYRQVFGEYRDPAHL